MATLFFGVPPAGPSPNASRRLIALTDAAEEAGTAGEGRIITAAANVSTCAAKYITAVTDGSIGAVEAARRGVDLPDAEIQGSSGRPFVESEDSWVEFLAEPKARRVLKLEPDTPSVLERLLLLSPSRRPRGEFTHAVFHSPQLYSLVSSRARRLPSGHVGVARGGGFGHFRLQWANPARAFLGLNETAKAASMADRLRSLALDSFPAPDLELGPDALVGAPPLPNGLPRRLLRGAARWLAWLERGPEKAVRRAENFLPPGDRAAGVGDGNKMRNVSVGLIRPGPFADAGGGERA